MDAERIVAYLEGGLDAHERESLESHLIECASCRWDLELASDAAHMAASRRRKRWTGGLGLAAAAVLAAIWLGGPAARVEPVSDPVVRGPAAAARVVVLAPTEGGALNARRPAFTWQAVPGATLYAFRLLDASGEVVTELETSDTTVTLPTSIQLVEGSEYHWLVDALLEGARSITSGTHTFTAGGS